MTKDESTKVGNSFPNEIIITKREAYSFVFISANGIRLDVIALRDGLIRFRYAAEDELSNDFSYALSDSFSMGLNELKYEEHKNHYSIKTKLLECRVNRLSMKTSLLDSEGQILCEDELGFHWEENQDFGGLVPKMSKTRLPEEKYYGMGDKPMTLNLSGSRVSNWNSDEYAFLPDQDPLYKSIPFYITLNDVCSYGIFFDNTFATHFDFGCEREEVTSFWADGGEMNYYFIYGPQMEKVVTTYTDLTGAPELPPLWALGYHQCKWSYYPQEKLLELADKFRELKIPCDALYLDIDYMDGFRCFTWDKQKFPDPKHMIDKLKKAGFHTVVIIDPGIKQDPDYDVCRQGLEEDVFCRRADGHLMKGKVWPGGCYFPDFTNPRVRKWWANQFNDLIHLGVAGVWNDMNEPAVMEVPSKTFPLDVRHDYDGHSCSHRRAHNVYGMQMARATFEGLKSLGFPRRPFVITRAAYSGAQRYCSTWTGDNIATWDHLVTANRQLQRMNISGMGFCSSDIGGFEEQPTPQLYARWIQMGVFHPFCRTHSSGEHGDQEPWVFGPEVLDIARSYIELRYRLMLYLYTSFYEYTRYGTPVLRSMVMEDQGDEQLVEQEADFMFGRHIVVCPIMEEDAKEREIYLPKGQWYGFHTHSLVQGGQAFTQEIGLADMPIFVRAGAVIPVLAPTQHTGQIVDSRLQLQVYFGRAEVRSRIYEDSFDGYDYKVGGYCLRKLSTQGDDRSFQLTQRRKGEFSSRYRKVDLQVIGLPFQVDRVEIDGQALAVQQEDNQLSLRVNSNFEKLVIKARANEAHAKK